jgi:hypothetical protein
MTRCPTTHGHYRCAKPANHVGNCEQFDRSGIAIAAGGRLDELGADLGVKRGGDSDDAYRARLWEAAT